MRSPGGKSMSVKGAVGVAGAQQQYIIDIDTDIDQRTASNRSADHVYNDKRITAAKLKQLLQQRPDITKLLGECIVEGGLATSSQL